MAAKPEQACQPLAVSSTPPDATGSVYLMRHATAEHNSHRHYPHRDPALAPSGILDARQAVLSVHSPDFPDLILVSPLSRALQTAQIIFEGTAQLSRPPEVQVWPDLRECNNSISSQGRSRTEMGELFPMYNFSELLEEWDYEKETHQRAVARAERVRSRIKELSARYSKIWVVTHSIFLSYMVNVKGRHFYTCESRKYRFATQDEAVEQRYGLNHDLRCRQDFGPTVLIKEG